MAFEIVATGHYVPANRVTNDDLARTIDTSDEWIRSHTGIGSRHVAAEKAGRGQRQGYPGAVLDCHIEGQQVEVEKQQHDAGERETGCPQRQIEARVIHDAFSQKQAPVPRQRTCAAQG